MNADRADIRGYDNGDHYPSSGEYHDKIIGAFFAVYNELGFGFLESVYSNAMAIELGKRAIAVRREVPVEVLYKGVGVGTFRVDLLVADAVLVEVKATEALAEACERQQVASTN